ncbi:MAG: DUF2442 domain-containing protein [Pseudomonadota bacterium]
MFLHVIDAKYVTGHKVEVVFNDGRRVIADLTEALKGKVFEALKDKAEFSHLTVDSELGTICWANGADLAPEYIYFQAFKHEPNLQQQFKQWGYLP